MPDELRDGSPSARSAQLIDLLDGLCTFAERLPAWIGSDGLPLSWDLYLYGMAYLRRSDIRQMLRQAEAIRAANAVEESYQPWRADLRHEEHRG